MLYYIAMKKFFKWILFILLILFVLSFAGVIIFVKTFDANRYKPQVISTASKVLGRTVSVDNITIDLSMKNGIILKVDGVSISDDPRFSKNDFFKLDSLKLVVDVVDLIFKRKVIIVEILLKYPEIFLIRDSSGRINAQAITSGSTGSTSFMEQKKSQDVLLLPDIFVRLLKVEGAKIFFKDNMADLSAQYSMEDIDLIVKDFVVPTNGLKDLDLNVDVSIGSVKTARLIVPAAAKAAFNVTGNDLTVKSLKVILGKGTIDIEGQMRDYMLTRSLDFSICGKGLELNDILEQTKAQVKISGVIAWDMRISGIAGDFNSIKANGVMEMKPVILKGVNILTMVLNKIPVFSKIAVDFISVRDSDLASRLKDEDTRLRSITAEFDFASQMINISPVAVESDDFIFNTKTQVDLAGNYSMDGDLKLSAQLSTVLGDAAQGFEYFYNDKDIVVIPVAIKGQGAQKPVIEITKMMKAMTQNALSNKGSQEINKVLEKYVGKDSGIGEAVTSILNKFLP